MKKHLCLVLALTLCLSLCTPVFAVSSSDQSVQTNMFEISGVHYFSKSDDNGVVSMVVSADNNMEVVIREKKWNYYYTSSIYVEDQPVSTYKSLSFWEDALIEARAKMTDQNKVYISDMVNISQDQNRVSSTAPFYDFLEEVYGPEYTGRNIASINEYPQRKVTEDLNHIVSLKTSVSLKKACEITAALSGILAVAPTPANIKAIAAAVGAVAAVGSALLPEGTNIDHYSLSAEYSRDGWCGGRRWNYETHYITFDAFLGDVTGGVNGDDPWDQESNYFSNTDQIMRDAYAFWMANN